MPRYVDVDKYLSDDFCDEHDNCTKWEDCFLCWVKKAEEDVAPVVHAKWEHKDGIYGVVYCSHCDFELKGNNTNYCPYCGAKMKGAI